MMTPDQFTIFLIAFTALPVVLIITGALLRRFTGYQSGSHSVGGRMLGGGIVWLIVAVGLLTYINNRERRKEKEEADARMKQLHADLKESSKAKAKELDDVLRKTEQAEKERWRQSSGSQDLNFEGSSVEPHLR